MIFDRNFIRLLPLLSCFVFPLTAQEIFNPIEITSENYETIIKARAAYVRVNPSYSVVPGDVYSLTYVRDISLQKASFYIESDYTINIAFFGRLNVKGYSYGRLKREVEALITKNYPDSLPQVAITTPGFFMVYVKGEVAEAIDVPAWGFMKLSSVLKDLLTPYSSERRVEIRNGKEESRFYDLFRSRRLGEREQDPFLKNGDTIILHRYDRKIKVDGEVHNPGIFELLPEEDLTILIEEYAKGMTPMADRSRVELTRYLSSSAEYGETLYLDFSKERFPVGFSLANMDIIKIPKKLDHQPLVFFQGAVGTSDNGTTVSNKLSLPITEGERLSFATRRIEDQFTLVSDLEKVLLARAELEEPLRINLQELLLKGNSREDPVLQDGDIIVVPFRQYKVYVGGAVRNPGQYPYIANRTWEYYIGLSGGFKLNEHLGTKVKITDVYGKKHNQKDRIIQPEDVLYAPLNHPLYWLKEYGTDVALLTTSIIATTTLIWQITKIAEGNYTVVVDTNTSNSN